MTRLDRISLWIIACSGILIAGILLIIVVEYVDLDIAERSNLRLRRELMECWQRGPAPRWP